MPGGNANGRDVPEASAARFVLVHIHPSYRREHSVCMQHLLEPKESFWVNDHQTIEEA